MSYNSFMEKNYYIKILEKQKAALERQIESVRMKYYGLEQQLKAVTISINAVKGDPKRKIVLKQEILTVLEDNPKGLHVSEIVLKIEEKNNLTVSKPSVSSTLTRLKKEEVVDYCDGRFTLKTEEHPVKSIRSFSDDDIPF